MATSSVYTPFSVNPLTPVADSIPHHRPAVTTQAPCQPTTSYAPSDASFAQIRPCFPSNPLARRSSQPAPAAQAARTLAVSDRKGPIQRSVFWGAGLKEAIEFLTPTIHRDTITSPLLETIATPFRNSLRQFPYSVPNQHHQFLQSCGINTSSFGYKAHPHPVHKTIEIHLLFDTWVPLATTPSSVMFMKESKFRKLQNDNPHFTELLNYRLTARDTTRYPQTASHLPTTETVFMHDALMYFTPAQVLDFFSRCPKLQKLYASLVVPPESDLTDVSFFPELYRFRTSGVNLVYELEGNPAHNYTQPHDAINWLKTTTITGPEFELTVSRLESWGPVHSLLIQRGRPPIHADSDEVDFKIPPAVLLPNASSLQQPIRDRLVPKSVYDALFIYVRAVRTLRTTDPAGFVRTQSSKPEHAWVTASAWDNLAHFALLTSSHRLRTTYYLFDSTLAKIAHWTRTHTLYLGAITAGCLTPAVSGTTLALGHLSRCRTAEFALAHRWIVKPDYTFLCPKAPLLSLKLVPSSQAFRLFRGTIFECELFPKLTAALARRAPLLRRALPTTPISGRSWKLAAIAALIPAALWACRWFIGPDSPQHMHDAYHALFHPELWRLTLKRTRVHASPQEFIAIDTAPQAEPTPPTPAQPTIAIEIVDSPPPAPAPATAPALTVVTAPVAVATAAEPAAQPEPLVSACAAPVLQNSPAPRAEAPSNTIPAPAPEPAPIPDPSQFLVKQHEFYNQPDPTLLAFGITAPASEVTAPEQTEKPAPVEHSDGLITATFGQTSAPVPTRDAPTPLERDPSAVGEVNMFSELFPGAFVGTSGSFLFRRRAGGVCPVPYPAMDCLLETVEAATHISRQDLWAALTVNVPDSLLDPETIRTRGLSTDHLVILARLFNFRATLDPGSGPVTLGMADAPRHFHIQYTPESHANGQFVPGHFQLAPEKTTVNGGLATDLASAALRFNYGGSLLPIHTVHTHKTCTERGKNLISNMKNGFDGILASIDPAHPSEARARLLTLDGIMDVAKPRSVRLFHLAGFAGCGKSYPISKLLKTAAFRDFKIAVPTTELRNEWKTILNLPAGQQWRLSTWESSLLKSARILVIDEVYKLPRGYLDLAIHADPTVEFVILLGDPLQGEYHSTHPCSSNVRLSSEIRYLAPYIDYYCLWSRRVPQNVARFFGVPSLNSAEGFVRHLQHLPDSPKILANSQNSARTLVECGRASTTIASSQGSTYDGPAYIQLDRNTPLLSASHSLVALTRSKAGIVFTGDRSQLHGGPTCNRIFSDFWASKPISLQGVFGNIFPNAIQLHEPLTSRQPKAHGAAPRFNQESPYAQAVPIRGPGMPTLKSDFMGDVVSTESIIRGTGELNGPQVSTHFLPETRRPLHADTASARPSTVTLSPADHSRCEIEPVYPGEAFDHVAAHFLPAHDPETREIVFRGTMSQQFPHINKPFELAAQPMTLLAAIHNEKNDPTLLAASIPKRLRFRPSDAPYQLSPKDEILGSMLYGAWCCAYRRNPADTVPFDPLLFAECINLNEFAQLSSKTQSTIMANANRSDPDWRWSVVRIFSKTQHKINENSLFKDWKACQTLALMHDAVVLLLGPVKKYQRIFDAADRPASLYVHAGNTPHQMSSWCQSHLTTREKLANDYTAFDQSQHGEAVVFERKKMERLNIPEGLINLHLHLKTHVTTQFGPLTCMRLTGEPGTYDDNTDYNLAVIHLEYYAAGVPTMVSGDDSILDFEPPRRPTWPQVEKLLALRFKKETGRQLTFCGFYVGKEGAIRSPLALFAKILAAIDDQSIDDKLASYLTEFSIGHSLGDAFWNLLPAEAVTYQSACFDFFCRRASPTLKLALKIGEVDPSTLSLLADAARWASGVTYSMLPTAIRHRLLKSARRHRALPENPDVTQAQGELLQEFRSRMNSDTLLPVYGGSSSNPHAPSGITITAPTEPMASNAQVGPPPASDDRVDRQPTLPRAPRLMESSAPIFIDYPFQWQIASYTGKSTTFVTDDLSASATLKTITQGYRHAELLHAELEFSPLYPSFSKPVTFSAVWTIASQTPTEGTETSFYGGRVFTIGGPVLMSSTTHLPADLDRINAVVKGPVSYNDCPRYSYTVYSCDSTNTKELVSVLIRGVIRLSGPAGAKIA